MYVCGPHRRADPGMRWKGRGREGLVMRGHESREGIWWEPPGHLKGRLKRQSGQGQDPQPGLSRTYWRNLEAGWKMGTKERGETQAGPCHGGGGGVGVGTGFGTYPENEGRNLGRSDFQGFFFVLAEQGTWDLSSQPGSRTCASCHGSAEC